MKERQKQKRAVATQIVGTFLVVISAYLLVAYVFVAKVNEDILNYKGEGKGYTIIAARKIQEYTQLASEQGVYQAIYELGVRGGYNNRTIGSVNHVNVSYGTVNVSTAIWMDERVDKSIPTAVQNIILKIPEDKTIEGNLTEVIRNATLGYLRIRAPESGMDIGPYENATFMVNRSECVSAEYAGMGKGCFNITIIPTNYTQKNYTSSGSLVSATAVTSTTNAHMEIRLFKMYELMRSFIKNNFLVKAGYDDPFGVIPKYNLLATQLEARTDTLPFWPKKGACPVGTDCDWDVKSRVTKWCPSQNNCDLSANGPNAKLNYSCVEQLAAPACKRIIKDNLESKIKTIEEQINEPPTTPYTIKCPASVPNCEIKYGTGRNLHQDPERSDSYKTERFNWTIMPVPPKTWDDVIIWDGASDEYNILWWNQSTAGECRLPQGNAFLSDTQFSKDTWTKSAFPEGTACADAYYVNCHEIKRYKSVTGWGLCFQSWSDQYAWCEMDAYKTSPGHTAACGASAGGDPYGGTWCSQAKTIIRGDYAYTCLCPPGCIIEPGLWNVVQTAYTHCDIQYDFYGHFKYRAGIGPLLVTLTDESRTIPVMDIYGQQKLEKPQLKSIYNGVVYEEPASDGCIDREGDEDKTGDIYYHAADTGKNECPKGRNPAAPRADYYTAAPC